MTQPASTAAPGRSAVRAERSTAALPRPGPLHGHYPQRDDTRPSAWLDLADRLGQRLSMKGWQEHAERASFRKALATAQAAAQVIAPHELPAHAALAAAALLRAGFTAQPIAQAQAVIGRAIELELGQRPYATQQIAAHAVLRDRLVEMDTGEGKTLALLLAAGTAALARVPTHVVCANDYLAQRDAYTARRVLSHLGLSVGAIRHDMAPHERRDAYACAIVYVSAQELGFDYLRDRLDARHGGAAAQPLLRGLCLALIDEADSVLLDHARTPLVLATQDEHAISHAAAQAIYGLGGKLVLGRDGVLHAGECRVELSPAVLQRCHEALNELGIVDDSRVRGQLLREAATARHALLRDVHYVVREHAVVLIDATTGRTLPGSVWTRGLHRMVCIKEGVAPPPATRTAIQITLQALFGRYCKLGGLSGTLRESAWQLWWFYRLGLQRVHARVPSRRRDRPLAVYARREQQFEAVRARVAERSAAGQAVLVGTDSVAAADALSAHLLAAGIAHRLLTARDDSREAALIAAASAPGAVTVATNIAGRGTDIVLHPITLAAGGLEVVCCTQNASPRIDRQLLGRAARNGQPGSAGIIVSLDDRAFADFVPQAALTWLRRGSDRNGLLPHGLGVAVARAVQATRVCRDFARSWQLVRHDRLSRESLAPATRAE